MQVPFGNVRAGFRLRVRSTRAARAGKERGLFAQDEGDKESRCGEMGPGKEPQIPPLGLKPSAGMTSMNFGWRRANNEE